MTFVYVLSAHVLKNDNRTNVGMKGILYIGLNILILLSFFCIGLNTFLTCDCYLPRPNTGNVNNKKKVIQYTLVSKIFYLSRVIAHLRVNARHVFCIVSTDYPQQLDWVLSGVHFFIFFFVKRRLIRVACNSSFTRNKHIFVRHLVCFNYKFNVEYEETNNLRAH